MASVIQWHSSLTSTLCLRDRRIAVINLYDEGGRIMRIKIILLLGVVVLLLVFSSLAGAEDIAWTTQQYTAYAACGTASQTSYGPLFPISAQASCPDAGFKTAFSTIHDQSNFSTNVRSAGTATATFDGNYIALLPLLQFDYSAYHEFVHPAYLDFAVTDTTTGTTIFSQRYINYVGDGPDSPYWSGSAQVNTTIGHDISVHLMSTKINEGNYSVSYSMAAVAPEPISSVLFIIGGALLTGRRFLKRKA